MNTSKKWRKPLFRQPESRPFWGGSCAIRLMAVPLALCRLRQRFHLSAHRLEIGFQGFRVIRRETFI